jgi:NAD(P)H-hydrate epimerase
LPERKETGHKNTFGHVLVIGGSNGMIGAPILAGIAALRSGAGLVSVIVPEEALRVARPEYPPELMLLGLPGSKGDFCLSDVSFVLDYIQKRNISCMAIGMGLGQGSPLKPFLSALLDQTHIPLVIDADGLAVFEGWKKPIPGRLVIATPHPGEYKAYFRNEGESVDLTALTQKAKDLGIQIAYKSTTPFVTDGDRVWIIPSSYSSLAKAGSGDVLAGILASFLAQGFRDSAAPLAVWVHNQIGRELNLRGEAYICTASDIAHLCRDVLKNMVYDTSLLSD